MAKKKHGDRFPLLVYAPLGRRWMVLGALLTIASLALWLLAPRFLGHSLLRHLAAFPALTGLVIFLYGLAACRIATVQCSRGSLRIQTPIYPLTIAYKRIAGTRPVQMSKLFDPQTEKRARRNWPARYWGMTALVIELKEFPMSERWLRLWFDRYLFWPQGSGFALLVEDWLGLSQQLDGYQADYKARLASARARGGRK